MTEAEWLACCDSHPMWVHLYSTEPKPLRKLALLGSACLRRIWPLLSDRRCQEAVAVVEASIEEPVAEDVLDAAWKAASDGWAAMAEAAYEGAYATPELRAMSDAGLAAYQLIDSDWQCMGNAAGAASCRIAAEGEPGHDAARQQELAAQVRLVRCIFGNPFRALPGDSPWRTADIVAHAKAIYADRAFDRLPILADTLEDAGCTDHAVLDHCRQPGEHVRGCWVVDLVLGKE